MDYGKLAYLRLEELEGALKKSTASRAKNTARAIYPDYPLRVDNDFAAAKFLGTGVLTAIVKIGVRVAAAGRIDILLDGQRVGFCDFESLGADENVSLLSLRIAGSGQVVLKAVNGFSGHITEFSVALVGDDAAIETLPHIFSADATSECFAHLIGNDGLIWLSLYDCATGSLLVKAEIGYGSAADVCKAADDSGFYEAYADSSQNLWLLKVANSGASIRVRIGDRADAVAVFDAGSGEATVAYLQEGVVRLIGVDYDFLSTANAEEVEIQGVVEDVGFVKNAPQAVLLTSMQGKVFARFAFAECKQADTFTADISATMFTVSSS